MTGRITIYSPEGEALITTTIRDGSMYTRVLMGEHTVRVRFDWDASVPLPYGSYILYGGEPWTLWGDYIPRQIDGYRAVYDVAFSAPEAELAGYTCFYLSGGGMEAEWSMAGTLEQWRMELECNLRRVEGLVGRSMPISVAPGMPETDTKHIEVNRQSILEVLGMVAEAFEVDWWRGADGVLYLGKLSGGAVRDVSLGELATSFTPQGELGQRIARLYAFGSGRNLTKAYRRGAGGVVNIREPRLMLPEGVDYVAGVSGGIEHVEVFEDVYPRYIGQVARVGTRTNQEGTVYRIEDTVFVVPQSAISDGEKLSVVFESGALRGMTFEVALVSGGYELVPSDTYGERLPGGRLVPQVGDRYAPFGFDISVVGDSYIPRAESELLTRAQRWLADNNSDRRDVELTTDPVYVYEQGVSLQVGDRLCLVGALPGGDKVGRITSLSYPLHAPSRMTVLVGEARPIGRLERMELEAERRQDEAKGYTDRETGRAIRMARREYGEAMEAMRALEGAVAGFEGGISPVAIRTMQLIAGDQSLQFRFVASYTSRTTVPFGGEWRPGVGMVIPESHLLHSTLGVRTITTDEGGREHPQQWNLQGATLRASGDDPLYLYALCERESMQAQWRLSPVALPFETAGHYQLLVGILGRPGGDGSRSFTRLYGYTEITPGMMRGIERIVSADGGTGIDLLEGRIWGNIRFEGGKDARAFITEVLHATPDASTEYLRQALLEGTTDIAGGLIATGVIALRDRLGDVRAYLDGRTTSGIAFGAGVSGYGTPIEARNITIRHDGSADIGEMHVEPGTGRITFVDSNGVYLSVGGELGTIQELAEHRVQTLTELVARRELAGVYRNGEALSDRHVLIANLGEITKDGFYLTIELSGRFTHGTHGGATTLRLQLERRRGTDIIPVWQMTSRRSESHELTISEGVVVPRGSWRLVLVADRQEYCDWRLRGFGGEVRGSSHGNGSRGRVALSGHGLVVWLGEGNVLSLTGGDGLRYRGRVDLPGVLASGTVQGRNAESSVGGRRRYRVAQSLGAHTLLCEDGGYDGYYLITHNLGHTNYQVQLTPQAEDQAVYLSYYHSSPTAVYVYAKGANGNPIRTDFGITFVGNNQ